LDITLTEIVIRTNQGHIATEAILLAPPLHYPLQRASVSDTPVPDKLTTRRSTRLPVRCLEKQGAELAAEQRLDFRATRTEY
jgi:hypothetical protein